MKKFTTKELCLMAVFTALISAFSQLSVPLPGGVPMTLQTYIIPVAGIVLGPQLGFFAALVYILLGAAGAPVFANFSGGFAAIAGMTGGFLVSFPLMALLAGLGDQAGRKAGEASRVSYYSLLVLFLIAGTIVNYAVGTFWFVAMTGSTVGAALAACVVPFIPTTILKIILTVLTAPVLKRAIYRAGIMGNAAKAAGSMAA